MNRRRSLRDHLVPWFLSACLALSAGSGCGRGRRDCEVTDLDEATVATLETARALHHEADVFEDSGRFADAAKTVQRILDLPIPRTIQEGQDIRLDAFGRLAELTLAAGDPTAALAHADAGLAEARRDSVLAARLHTLRGRSLRALAERAKTAGDEAGAATRRQQAMDALEASINMNARVLARIRKDGTR